MEGQEVIVDVLLAGLAGIVSVIVFIAVVGALANFINKRWMK